MRIEYQWALDPAAPWEAVDSVDWASLPSRPAPAPTGPGLGGAVPLGPGQGGGENRPGGRLQPPLDGSPGWLYRVNVQGIDVKACEHLAVVDGGAEGWVEVTTWWTEDAGIPAGAQRWKLWPGWERNTYRTPYGLETHEGPRQELTVWTDAQEVRDQWAETWASGGPVVVHDLAAFVEPAPALVRHGVSMSPAAKAAHLAHLGSRLGRWAQPPSR